MSEVSEDMALKALLDAAGTLAPTLSREALRQAYEIGKASQYEESRESAVRALAKLADAYSAGGN